MAFLADVADEVNEPSTGPIFKGAYPSEELRRERDLTLAEKVAQMRIVSEIALRSEIKKTREEYFRLFYDLSENLDFGIIFDRLKTGLNNIKADLVEFFSPSFWAENLKLIADTFENTFLSITGLFSTLSDIRQEKLDEELRTSTTLSDEERKVKEANAKKSFETSKKLTLAGIALQTGLAVIKALADTNIDNFWVRAANATAAAATGAAQYARANAQQYSAPSAPSGASVGTQVNNNQSSSTNVTINVTGGRASSEEVVNAVKQYVGQGGVIINRDTEQGSVLIG